MLFQSKQELVWIMFLNEEAYRKGR